MYFILYFKTEEIWEELNIKIFNFTSNFFPVFSKFLNNSITFSKFHLILDKKRMLFDIYKQKINDKNVLIEYKLNFYQIIF